MSDPETERLRRDLEEIINAKPKPPQDDRYVVMPVDPVWVFRDAAPPPVLPEPDIWNRPQVPKPDGFFHHMRVLFRALLNKATRI